MDFFLKTYLFYLMWMVFCPNVCLHITCVLCACGGQKRTSEPLVLELQVIVSQVCMLVTGMYALGTESRTSGGAANVTVEPSLQLYHDFLKEDEENN